MIVHNDQKIRGWTNGWFVLLGFCFCKKVFFSLVRLFLGVVILSETIESTIKMWDFLFFPTAPFEHCDSLLHKCSVPSYSRCSHSQQLLYERELPSLIATNSPLIMCIMNLISFKGFCFWGTIACGFFFSSSSILYSQEDLLFWLIRSKAMYLFLV